MIGETTRRELLSQPDRWTRLLARLESGNGVPALSVDAFDEIVLIGSGSSYYLALAAADWIRRRHAVAARAVPSCEIMLDAHQAAIASGPRRLVLAISRSGESSELLLAIEALSGAGTTVLGIGCIADSTLMRMADITFVIDEGREDGLVMSRSFTSMLIALQHLFGFDDDRAVLRGLPDAARVVLDDQSDELRAIAHQRPFDRFVYLASGPSYPIALEASLKLQEMSISTSEAYHSLEYRHGPKATAGRDTLLTLFTLSDVERGLSLARDMKALGVTLLVVGPGADRFGGVADIMVAFPAGLDAGAGNVLSLLPLQLLAFETAMRLGKDPDAPENLNKVVILEATHA